MPLSTRIFILLFCAPLSSRAQTPVAPPAAPAHSHTPPGSSHPSGVVVLDQFVTSAQPFARNQVDLAQSTTVLSGQSLLLKKQATLGDTLASESGIQATSFGPGASRPIIRGLGGDRIRLLENSIGTMDASVTSPDHAVSIEPFLVERIEVVRGPASLLYGSNAVGGVVNVITHRIETDLPTERVRAGAELRAGTAADEVAGGGVLDLALISAAERALVVHVDGFRRRTENLRIPGYA
jgi:iron complex outermembrane recepter protein